MQYETADSIYLNSNSQFQSSASVSAVTVIDKLMANQGSFSADCTSLHMQESVAEAVLPGSHFIPNWIPISVLKNPRDSVGEEVDFGASAITAASSLASGSLHIPSEQQHVQANLKAAFAGISIVLSFHDEYRDNLCDLISISSNIHYLGIECRDISLVMQVCPQEMRFEGTMEHVEADDYLCCKKDGGDCRNSIDSKTFQSEICKMKFNGLSLCFPPHLLEIDRQMYSEVHQVVVLERSSFSLKLPPLIVWFNFCLLKMLSDLLKGSGTSITTLSSAETLTGNISIPNARVILCFPFKKGEHDGGYSSWDRFIVLDISSPLPSKGGMQHNSPHFDRSLQKQFSSSGTHSLHLNIGNLCFYSVTSAHKDGIGIDYGGMLRHKFSAQKILSVSNRTGYLSVISMFWQEDPVTGPWIAERAEFLAMLEENRSRSKYMGKVDLDSSQNSGLHSLLNQMIAGLSCFSCDATGSKEENSLSQTLVLLECDAVEISIRPDAVQNVKGPMQSELPGSWVCLKLKLQKFDLLSVSNIGVTTMKRGDGGGSNALSSRLAGSDIVHFWEPESCLDFTSITVRCSTIVAVGGCLDLMDVIYSFFSLPALDPEQSADNSLQKRDLDTPPRGASVVLKLVDVSLSYEPHLKNLAVHSEVLDSESASSNAKKDMSVACLLAASSFSLSNPPLADSLDNEYKISIQDLGLLLRAFSDSDKLGGTYSAEQLNHGGYVKVAWEALIEAVVKTNCNNGLLWEVGCSKSQIYMETCHDTTSGLIRLAAQLQQLFAPNVEESIVHLQTRWNNFQQAQQRNDEKSRVLSCDCGPSTSQTHTANVDLEGKCGVVGLMDEICEDAFHLDGNETFQFNSSESQFHLPLEESVAENACSLSFENAEMFSHDLPVNGIGLESSQTSFLQKEPSGQAGLKQTVEGKLSYRDCSVPDDTGNIIGRVFLKNINFRWRMYAGSDWRETRKSSKQSKNIHGRDTTVCLELAVSGVEFQYDIFPAGGISVSKLYLSVRDFHLYDKSTDAPWKLVLRYYDSKDHPRESSSKAFKLDLEAVRPDPFTPLEEYRLRIAFLPMLLHLRQSQLDFLISFSGEKSSSIDQSTGCPQDLDLLVRESCNLAGHAIANEALLPYFQASVDEFIFVLHILASLLSWICVFNPFSVANCTYDQNKFDIWPTLVRVDYRPRHVDLAALRGGKYVELVNIVPWKGVELELKHVHAVGVYGWGSVCETIIGEWLEDISQNQLVSLPIKRYRKDQRILKGMQRGTIAFL
ncbi:hypothetical protein CRYUN_Cryun06bG0049400 [Craigia yunnanensis]